MIGPIAAGDSLIIDVDLVDVNDAPLDLTGATLATSAKQQGMAPVAGAAEAVSGAVRLTYAAGLLGAGDWLVQLRVTSEEGEVQTVWSQTVRLIDSAFL